jgi:hypothetical protein
VPRFAETCASWNLVPLLVWNVEETAVSPDGELQAVHQIGDQGALGWGPRRVVLQRAGWKGGGDVLFVAPDRAFGLEPRWTGPDALEVVVHSGREATLAELASSRFTVAKAGHDVAVTIVWKEWGSR